jgi:hypothetical protein
MAKARQKNEPVACDCAFTHNFNLEKVKLPLIRVSRHEAKRPMK